MRKVKEIGNWILVLEPEVMDAFKIGAIFYRWMMIYLLVCSLTVIREWRA